jgi:hypothetical protein
MKTELEEKLLKKYPQFFRTDRKIYTGGDSTRKVLENVIELLNQEEMVLPIQFGLECGNGWYMLLDELMSEIDNHLKNVNRWREKGKHKYKLLEKWSYNLRIRSAHKQKMRKKLGEWIEKNAPRIFEPPLTIQIDQIKEKFGGLRFYYSGGDDEIAGMVSLAESLSYKICESCGSTKNIGYTKGWITTMCQECYDKNPKKENLRWELRNENK